MQPQLIFNFFFEFLNRGLLGKIDLYIPFQVG